jgi:GNAT superfamily N-acetyltransferase
LPANETHMLDNAAWWSLGARHQDIGEAIGRARRYRRDVSVFSAVDDFDEESWADLAELVGTGGTCTVFRGDIPEQVPSGWIQKIRGQGRQMTVGVAGLGDVEPVPIRRLTEHDVTQMLELVTETKPGPFLPGTIALGTYVGHFEGGRLIAMAGERFHPEGFTEISAVCTHPDARGRGLASALTHLVATEILARNEQPFLHVAETNDGARRVYEGLGFEQRRLVDLAVLQRTPG